MSGYVKGDTLILFWGPTRRKMGTIIILIVHVLRAYRYVGTHAYFITYNILIKSTVRVYCTRSCVSFLSTSNSPTFGQVLNADTQDLRHCIIKRGS